MQIATPDALATRPVPVRAVPDAFGPRGGCWVRGYTDAELALMTHAATRGGVVDGARLAAIQAAQCLLASPDPAGPRLLGAEPQPQQRDLDLVASLPPAAVDRLVQISDDLVGLDQPFLAAYAAGQTWLPAVAAPDDGELRLVDVSALVTRERLAEPAELLAGAGQIWVREYDVEERAAWQELARRGSGVDDRRLRWAKLAACLVTGPEPGWRRLIGEGTAVTAEQMAWIGQYLWTAEQLRLARLADALSGWLPTAPRELVEAQLPFAGSFSQSGPSGDVSGRPGS